jgi:hypothetical protein
MNDWLGGVLGCVVLVTVLVFGFGMGQTKAADDCDALGKFRKGDVIYVCQREVKKQ